MSRRTRRETATDLSLDDVLKGAIRVLDSDGIEAFSMRTLAQALGRSTMAAYRYVPNRDALVRLAADAVDADLPPMESEPWYTRLEMIARHGWTTAWQQHPWVVEYLDKVEVTPKAIRRRIALEQIFDEAGFTIEQIEVALPASWTWLVGLLDLIIELRRTTGRVDLAVENARFEFSLRAWILGVTAIAYDLDAAALQSQKVTSPRP
jgi:AcrR family transcriptional regulator